MKLQPIKPFEPIKANKIPAGDGWVAQVKWDGVRILTYYEGEAVKLYNRNLNDKTNQYPELQAIEKYCNAESVILDGEIVALDEGLPSFHNIMKRDRKKIIKDIKKLSKEIPIYYMIFDLLFLNGEWMIDMPFSKREGILKQIITPIENVLLVQSFKDGEKLFKAVKEKGLEGIVSKNLTKPYKINNKDNSWVKIKNYSDIIAVVGGVTIKDEVVNSLLLGLYDSINQLHYIGHAGTGKLRSEEWRALTELIKPIISKEMPFINTPKRAKESIWIKPELTVKVQFIEWTKGNTLRQPSIQGFVEQSPKSCTLGGSLRWM